MTIKWVKAHEFQPPVGRPFNFLAHESIKLGGAEWSIRGEATNKPGPLLKHLQELTSPFPGWRLITGDAIYNQPDVQDAVKQAISLADQRPPAAETLDKTGGNGIAAASGLSRTTPAMFGSDWAFPDATL